MNFTYPAVVRRVIDGDTIVVDIDQGFRDWKHDQRIRLLGVDAPALSAPGGPEARLYLLALLPSGSPVQIRTHRDRRGNEVASFERWVAEVWLPGEGSSVGSLLLAAGHAVPS